ncbi:MAG: hypothetical protein J6Q60_05820 [Bacteroidaceae bacterium]|nr:hypothetical protein [Bacteroidaceae bacterium]
MNKTLSNLFIFTAGAAIGSAVTWKLVKDKYARLAQEEIEAVREVYMKHDDDSVEPAVEEEPAVVIPESVPEFTEQERVDYANIANTYNNNNEKGVPKPVKKPYVISPDMFEEGEYQAVSLTYYADGVVEDDFYDVWDDDEIEEKIGRDFMNHYGEYEEDTVFVRNDEEETDYEIMRDTRRYSDVPKQNPYPGCD